MFFPKYSEVMHYPIGNIQNTNPITLRLNPFSIAIFGNSTFGNKYETKLHKSINNKETKIRSDIKIFIY
jgi:hypothetical protein